MRTLRSLEGLVTLDHRGGPGMSEADAYKAGLPKEAAGSRLFETPSFTCSHCQAGVYMNPDRSRSRGHCSKCNHYICDNCHADLFQTGICFPYRARASEYLEAVDKGDTVKSLLLLP